MVIKTIYKKLFITGIATLVLEGIIVYFLYTTINAFYSDLTNKIAFLLTDQVREVIVSDNFDISKLSQYNKYPVRRLLKRFSSGNSEILHILLIDKDYRIVVSDASDIEGKEYLDPDEISLLDTDKPQVLSRQWEGDIEIVDVIFPLRQSDQVQGYLRTVISVKHLKYFWVGRTTILVGGSLIAFAVILLTVFFTSRIYQSNLKDVNLAIEKLNQSEFDYQPRIKRNDEFSPLFSGIHKLYEKTMDLNESFQQSEDRIRAMMQVIHEGLLIIDMNMKIVSFNQYLLEIFQFKRYLNPEERIYQVLEKNPKLLDVYRRAKDPLTHTIRRVLVLRLLNGSLVNIQVNAMPISDAKSTSGIILYIKNLGVLQELEQNLHRSMKYGVISQLASSIGHEIRNPLSSLAIHTEIVDNLVSKSVTDDTRLKKIKKSVGVLNSEVERLNKMIGQFFNLAKSQEIQLTCENVNKLIDDITDIVQQEANEKNVEIHKDFAENLPMIYISRDQIKQVIINLILNAFDAMNGGGDLFLKTEYNNAYVVISVKDTGRGIPEEVREHIFDLYFSTKPSGGGIGLAISRKIIEAHEGKIYFNSVPQQGTEFSVELPTS
jgi:signal transduction histidine kinase